MNREIHLSTRAAGRIVLATLFGFLLSGSAQAQTTNSVTAGDSFNYTINTLPDPPFTLQRGVTYVFQLSNIPSHPFWIRTNLVGDFSGGAARYTNGVTGNGATSGNVIFAVPATGPDLLYYQCGNHSAMHGTFVIETPVVAPTVRIVYISVANLITLKSTGTNGWNAIPEFRCGISGTNWTTVPSYTNTFLNNTNTTTFNRLDAICGSSNVILRVRNQKVP